MVCNANIVMGTDKRVTRSEMPALSWAQIGESLGLVPASLVSGSVRDAVLTE